ncbi:MAG TPA: hypothetical protein VJR89_35160, partial [Polyangiales bacterium]|nr:hypothetical protein [Polyangiales bacterium]
WQLAQEMLAEQPRHGRRVAAALHLVLAGEEARGADIIAEAGRAYLRDASAYDSTKVVVRALEQALAIYDRLGRPQAELLGVLHPLVTLGYYVDFRLVRDHGERGLAIGLEVTGLARAMQLSRFVGNKLALAIALGTAALKFRRVQREGFRYGLRDALMGTGVLVPGLVGFGAVTADLEMLERVRELLAPLRLLGNPVLYGFVEINRWLVAGHVHKVDETAAELARQCRSPELVARIG